MEPLREEEARILIAGPGGNDAHPIGREAATLVSQSSSRFGGEERLRVPMGILLSLAAPRYRGKWASVWRSLLTAFTDDKVRQGLEQLGPVAEVLETGDRSKLDPLPPDQRSFVEEVLRKFDGLPAGD